MKCKLINNGSGLQNIARICKEILVSPAVCHDSLIDDG